MNEENKAVTATQTLPSPTNDDNLRLALDLINALVLRVEKENLPVDGIVAETELKIIAEASGLTITSVRAEFKNRVGAQSNKDDLNLSDLLVELFEQKEAKLFHNKSGDAFATVPVDEHMETWQLHSKGFKKWLRRIWYLKFNRGISVFSLDEAISTLESKAIHAGGQHEVYVRIAHIDGAVYIDLGDAAWRCIRINSTGWEIINDSPVKFIRTLGMLSLPEPVAGGKGIEKLAKLKSLLNVSDTTWKRIVAWILAAYSEGPYWILILTGEQDTAKTFATRLLRTTVDPCLFEILTAPEEKRDIIIAAVNQHVLAIDNLSGIPDWQSDLYCGISTGTASRQRAYHTNNGEEVAFIAKKPIILNGIDFAIRDDLASRTLLAPLSPIATRKNEKEIRKQFDSILPEVLGGIFDILVDIFKELPITATPAIRMADAGKWVAAAETSLGWTKGEFLQLYGDSRNETVELAIESDNFCAALVEQLDANPNWCGSWKDLSTKLLADPTKPPRGWPTSGKAVAGSLKRLAPALRHKGYAYEHKSDGKVRYIKFSAAAQVSEGTASGDTLISESDASVSGENKGSAPKAPLCGSFDPYDASDSSFALLEESQNSGAFKAKTWEDLL